MTRRIVRTVLRTKLAMIANFVSTAANALNPDHRGANRHFP